MGAADVRLVAVVTAVAFTAGACAASAVAGRGTATVSPTGQATNGGPISSVVSWQVPPAPATIDTSYVQEVMGRLDVIYGDAFRTLERDRTLSPRVGELLSDAFEGVALAGKLSDFGREIQTGFTLVRSNPGNPTTVVLSLLSTDRSCVLARTQRSLAGVYQAGFNTGLAYVYVALRPAPATADRSNRTGWRVSFDGARQDDSAPTDACTAP